MTIVAYHLLKIYLKKNEIPFFIYIAAFFMGVGWGSCIEIYEFLVAISIEENGVGGYYNNALDLFFNTLGALFASMILYLKDNKKNL
jgi:glycopeptide antibiotics resistance protein